MHRIAWIVCSTVLAASTAAAAQQDARFETLDKDGNGKVSLTEASEHDGLFVAFKNLDSDKDGELTREEFARFKSAQGA